jgi:hypothetical protein
VRSLRRMQKSSNLFVDTTVSSHGDIPSQATMCTQEPVSRSLPNHSLRRSKLLSSDIPLAAPRPNPSTSQVDHHYPQVSAGTRDMSSKASDHSPQHRRYASAVGGANHNPRAGSLAARSAVSAPTTPDTCLRSRSRGWSFSSYWRSKRRPTISEPEHPRLLASAAGPRSMEQPLIRYATLTHEGHEFAPASSSVRPSSRHNVDTPDPLRCHSAGKSSTSKASYISTNQHLTSSQRWKRAQEQEHHLVKNLQSQLDAMKLELEQTRPEIAQLRRELEEQRTRADHFKKAEAAAMKQSLAPFLAVESLNAREYIDSLVKKNKRLEHQYNLANVAKIRAETIAANETAFAESQRRFIKAKARQTDQVEDELEQTKAELKKYKARCETLEAALQVPHDLVPTEQEEVQELQKAIDSKVPSRTFTVLLKKMGRPQYEVNSSSDLSNILPTPLPVGPNSPLTSYSTPEASSETLTSASAPPQDTEVKIKRSSQLRSFKLPQHIKLQENAKEKVSEQSSSQRSSWRPKPLPVRSNESFFESSTLPSQSSPLLSHLLTSLLNSSSSSIQPNLLKGRCVL